MRHRADPLIIVGGDPGTATTRLALRAATAADGSPVGTAVVWGDLDVGGCWTDRRSAFVVRARPVRTYLTDHVSPDVGRRAGDLELRFHLRRHGRSDLLLFGHRALGVAPWLRGHAGHRVWFPTSDDHEALGRGVEIPQPSSGGPHHIVTTGPTLARLDALRSDPRHRWVPGFTFTSPCTEAGPTIVAWGPPDPCHGIDLVAWAVARRAADLRVVGARIRWIGPVGSTIAAGDAVDLERAGVTDLIDFEQSEDPQEAFLRATASAAALVLCGRPSASVPFEETLASAFQAGIPIIQFDDGPAVEFAGDWVTPPPFAEIDSLGDAMVRSIGLARRPPGPIGLAALADRVEGRGPA